MSPDDLRYFLAVRRARSIKSGARALDVDHSTVSRRLAALEEALGARLFERTPEGLIETEVGRAIAPLAENLDTICREIRDAARAASSSPAGPVRIAVAPLFCDAFLMPRVPELMRRFPDVAFDVHADISRVSMIRREADIAIRQHPPNKDPAEPSALARKVCSFGFAAYASPAYLAAHGRPAEPITDLRGHSMIDTGAWGPAGAWNASLDVPAQYSLSAYPFSAAISACAAGIGIAVLPCPAVDGDPRLVRLTPLLARWNVWVVTSESARENARVRAVKEALVELIERDARLLAGEDSPP